VGVDASVKRDATAIVATTWDEAAKKRLIMGGGKALCAQRIPTPFGARKTPASRRKWTTVVTLQ